MKTKDRIVECAVRLFNEQGTPEVSTNHIADACGISPGNLYYHFRNKADIIRAVLEQMFSRWGELWAPGDTTASAFRFRETLERSFALQWDYRFFYRELNFLLLQDGSLKARYREMQHRRMEEQEAFVRRSAEAGVLQLPEDAAELRRILAACWVLANHWLSHMEAAGEEIGPLQMQEGIRVIESVLKPYWRTPNES